MIPIATKCRLGAWFAGLFLFAQILGVGPVLREHTTHVAETELALSTGNAAFLTISHSQRYHHYRGDADGFAQHHELQDLTGAYTCVASPCEPAFVHAATTAYASDTLRESQPILLERPPKPFLSV
jgi:hypothetical protein